MKKIQLVLLWHMHQPDYRHYDSREFEMPWVYLHAIKDYADMAFHLESHPGIKAVVNFVPVLLDQLEDYVDQFSSGLIRDPLLRLLATPDLDKISDEDQERILTNCFKANHNTMLKPYPAYTRLHDLYDTLQQKHAAGLVHFSARYLADLLVWYHLAWTGESVRRNNETILQLMTKSENFSYAERMQLFSLIGALIKELIPRYRRLVEKKQIEISTTPHYHPLSPLLIDFSSARESIADASLPASSIYPGGRNRVAFHLDKAVTSHARRFATKPAGIWPAEGAVSSALIPILAEYGCQWCASSETVLANSLRNNATPDGALPARNQYLYRPYRIPAKIGNVICFFRDDTLSDLIGFEYAKWYGRDAAEHFVDLLEQAALHAEPENNIISVILDGENAWEYYPYNGFFFLDDLYTLLENHADIGTTTYSDYIAAIEHTDIAPLPVLTAGSWVYGSFSTWIGDPEKNRAWDLLCAAKHSYDLVMQSERLTEAEKTEAELQLASCESSDWFWWFGDYNQACTVIRFDQLYRDNLANLYRLLKLPVPTTLTEPISKGNETTEESGAMRRSS